MLPDRVSNPGPLTYESGALPIALRGPALMHEIKMKQICLAGMRSDFIAKRSKRGHAGTY